MSRPSLHQVVLGVLTWAIAATVVGWWTFTHDSRETVVAGHDAVVRPTLDGWATLRMGAYIPDVRYPSGDTVGVWIDVGKTDVDSYPALLERYALIATHPEGEIDQVSDLVRDMLIDAVVTGALLGSAVPVAWVAVGHRRRRELWHATTPRRAGAALGVAVLIGGLFWWAPWGRPAPAPAVDASESSWQPVQRAFPGVPFPARMDGLQVRQGLTTSGIERLVRSAVDTYNTSTTFYDEAAELAGSSDVRRQLHQPADDETVAVFVTDRHDNVGMDRVARSLADSADATVLFDGGDDTSTGSSWEAFSLDSLVQAFHGYEQFGVTGNHDNGSFVGSYLDDLGMTMMDGDVIDGPDGITLLGAPDPRSSGLGSWRDDVGGTLEEQRATLADTACEADEDGDRVSTMLVHDASVGRTALRRGCVDLVIGGHLHVQVGPDPVTGADGQVGWRYTNGTTGGAAYAVAIGSKPRRDAQLALITYRAGRPVGLQPVTVRTDGLIIVADYVPLTYE